MVRAAARAQALTHIASAFTAERAPRPSSLKPTSSLMDGGMLNRRASSSPPSTSASSSSGAEGETGALHGLKKLRRIQFNSGTPEGLVPGVIRLTRSSSSLGLTETYRVVLEAVVVYIGSLTELLWTVPATETVLRCVVSNSRRCKGIFTLSVI